MYSSSPERTEMKFLSNRRKRFPLFFAILGIAGAAILFLSGVLAMNAGPPLSSAFLLLISLCLITGATPGVASLMVFRGIPVAVKYDDLEVSFTFKPHCFRAMGRNRSDSP